MYWHVEGRIGRNTVVGRVRAENELQAVSRGLAAIHAKYPNSVVVVLGGKCRPSLCV